MVEEHKTDQAEMIDLGPLIEDSRFNMEAHTVKKKKVSVLFEWLV